MSAEIKQEYIGLELILDKLNEAYGIYGREQDYLTDRLERLWWKLTNEEQVEVSTYEKFEESMSLKISLPNPETSTLEKVRDGVFVFKEKDQDLDRLLSIYRRQLLTSIGRRLQEVLNGIGMARNTEKVLEKTEELNELKKDLGPPFEEQIFMGSGDHSLAEIARLHLFINEAVSVISGKQQNGGMGYEFDCQTDEEDQAKLEEICRSVVAALGCKKILKENK